MQPEKFKYRNPIAKKLKEDRAFSLKVIDGKRKSKPKKISLNEATKLNEEDDDEVVN